PSTTIGRARSWPSAITRCRPRSWRMANCSPFGPTAPIRRRCGEPKRRGRRGAPLRHASRGQGGRGAEAPDLQALVRGDKPAWDAFVRRYAGLILSAVRGVAREGGDVEDLAQEVFVRLCKDDFRLLKTYDPTRAGLSTWLTIVARSTARD